jgi:homoprotocatechuate degradation regulator HpaR
MIGMTAESPRWKTRAPASGRDPEPLRDFSRSLPMALLRAREAVMSRFRPMLQDHGLTEQQWRVLRALTASPTPLRLGEIAAATFVSLPSLSRLAKTLETRGVVKRVIDTGDLRAARISLTRSGRALVLRIGPQSEAGYAEIEKAIGVAELERLYRQLDRVRTGLAPLGGDPAADD